MTFDWYHAVMACFATFFGYRLGLAMKDERQKSDSVSMRWDPDPEPVRCYWDYTHMAHRWDFGWCDGWPAGSTSAAKTGRHPDRCGGPIMCSICGYEQQWWNCAVCQEWSVGEPTSYLRVRPCLAYVDEDHPCEWEPAHFGPHGGVETA